MANGGPENSQPVGAAGSSSAPVVSVVAPVPASSASAPEMQPSPQPAPSTANPDLGSSPALTPYRDLAAVAAAGTRIANEPAPQNDDEKKKKKSGCCVIS